MMNSGQFKSLRGCRRRELLQLHRLTMFMLAFDAYLAGRVGPEVVRARARKMLAIGLPKFKSGGKP